MPVVRLCPHCRKGFLKSTYQMIEHATKCNPNATKTIICNNRKYNILQHEGEDAKINIKCLEKIAKK
jgi:hypothetical protein